MVKSVVVMEPTQFRTVSLFVAGSRAAVATPLVEPRPTFQRVVILQNTGAVGAFVSESAQELNIPAASFGQAFQLIPNAALILVVSPNQTLYGAGISVATRVSIATSAEVPMPSDEWRDEYPATSFRTITVPTTEAIQIVPGGAIPKRVVIESRLPGGQAAVSSIFISGAATELNLPSAVPGGAFELLRPTATTNPSRVVLLTAPQQPLYAIQRPAAGPANISVSYSNLHLPALRGPTGIPGPDGEE